MTIPQATVDAACDAYHRPGRMITNTAVGSHYDRMTAALEAAIPELLDENQRLSQRVTRLSNLERRNAKQRDSARARLAAVEKLHQPIEAIAANGDTITVCNHCVGDLAYVFDEQVNWPCPTIQAARGE